MNEFTGCLFSGHLADGWAFAIRDIYSPQGHVFEAEVRHQSRGERLRARGFGPAHAMRMLLHDFDLPKREPTLADMLEGLASEMDAPDA